MRRQIFFQLINLEKENLKSFDKDILNTANLL